jgi:predicted RNase H-like HicB family nuclease
MEKVTRDYTIILHRGEDQGGFWVTVPALPGCVSQGETIEEAIAMAREAIELHIKGILEDGEPLPVEKHHPQAIVITVAA